LDGEYKRGKIVIKDRDGLLQSACKGYGTIKAHYDRLLRSKRTDVGRTASGG
jgi:hypothetical protein